MPTGAANINWNIAELAGIVIEALFDELVDLGEKREIIRSRNDIVI